MNPGDGVRVVVGGKVRPGVVVEALVPTSLPVAVARVACGSSQAPDDGTAAVLVLPDDRAGKALQLSRPTWFQYRNVGLFRVTELEPTGRPLPKGVFFSLRAMIAAGDESLNA